MTLKELIYEKYLGVKERSVAESVSDKEINVYTGPLVRERPVAFRN